MNKTIIININGMVFHIEEDAYEILKAYMNDIKRHFAFSSDCDEIITDIENRLAEMFTERLNSAKQVIILQDVNEITGLMGSVKDFEYPEEESAERSTTIEKRLFRDPDDRAVAGVCAGLAHYLNIETRWVRVATVLIAITTGLSILLYFILWIVIPEANSRQDKMAMKGEPINLQGFKKTFESENNNQRSAPIASSANSFESVIGSIFNFIIRILKTVVKGIGLFVALAAFAMLIGLFSVLIFGFSFIKDTDSDLYYYFLNNINPEYVSSVYLAIFLILGIPLIALIAFAVRVIFNYKFVSRTGAFAMLVLWITGLGIGVFNASKVAAQFKQSAGFEQVVNLQNRTAFHLRLNRNTFLTSEDSESLNLDDSKVKGKIFRDDDNVFDDLRFRLYIEKSETDKAYIVKSIKSRGRNFNDAINNAQGTSYLINEQDSILTFDKYLHLKEGTLYRAQELRVTLKIPVNTKLIVSPDLDWYMRDFSLWNCRKDKNNDHESVELIMTNEGLKCADQPQDETNNE